MEQSQKQDYKGLLPIGSVVKLAGFDRDFMVCGRVVVATGEDKIYDYVGFIYPEGIGTGDDLVFFDRDNIESVQFIGYQDEFELMYRTQILDDLGELAYVNGEIVPVSDDED